MTYEQMKAKTDMAIKTAYDTVNYFNNAPLAIKNNLRNKIKKDLNSLYMKYDKVNDEFIINDILPKLELYNYEVNQIIYKNGLSIANSYRDNNIEAFRADYVKVEDSISTKKLSFKDAFLQYAEIAKNTPHAPALLFLEEQQPLVKAAYEKLGLEKVRNLRYTKSKIEAALNSLDADKTTEQRIAIMMVGLIPTGTTITVDHANKLMEQAYYQLGLKRKAKSTDLHKWFDCSAPKSKRINGKPTKVVDIYRSKIIFGCNNNNEE